MVSRRSNGALVSIARCINYTPFQIISRSHILDNLFFYNFLADPVCANKNGGCPDDAICIPTMSGYACAVNDRTITGNFVKQCRWRL